MNKASDVNSPPANREFGEKSNPLLEVTNLSVSYITRSGAVPVVTDVSLSVRQGESVGLVGESGCGKSTLAMAIMGHLPRPGKVVAGSVLIDGQPISQPWTSRSRVERRPKVAMVYQEPTTALNPVLTIGQQLREGLIFHDGLSHREANDRAIAALTDVKIPDPQSILQRYPFQLSGGQQQRVVIAMAFLLNPSLLVLDEPTTALDVTVQAAVLDLLRELGRQRNTSFLYISHNLGLIRDICDRVNVMYGGEIVEEGPIQRVFRAPRHPYTRALFGCLPSLNPDRPFRALIPIRGQVSLASRSGCNFGSRCELFSPGLCDTQRVELRQIADGHFSRCLKAEALPTFAPAEAAQKSADRQTRNAPAVLRAVEVSKEYWLSHRGPHSVVRANDRISFEARRGQTLAVVGESGCGKSTLAKILAGLESASSGSVRFGKRDISKLPVRKRSVDLLKSIQMIFQDPDSTLNPSHTVGWALGRAVKKLRPRIPGREVRSAVYDLLRMVHLSSEIYGRTPRQLSGGQKQRVAIARALAGDPTLVVADEPVSALDVSVQAAIVSLLADLRENKEVSMVFISHDLAVVRYLSDFVVVMYLGQVMESAPVDQLFSPPYHPYTEALISSVPVAESDVEITKIILKGETPSPLEIPRGCRFSSRCPRKIGSICDEVPPPAQLVGTDHEIRCHIPLDKLPNQNPLRSTPKN